MKRGVLLNLLVLLAAAGCARGGALFDDYLNPVRPGDGTGPGPVEATATSAKPIGQSFSVPQDTAEVYRIGIRPVYGSWNKGEKVMMTLYESSARKTKLGYYIIEESTCHVRDYVVGGPSAFKHSNDRVLYFQFRKPTQGKEMFFFEISVAGGDGKVSFQAFDENVLAAGLAYPAGVVKDLSFEVDIKPVADREANLHSYFTERLDLTRPELAAVKSAVDAKNWGKAITETVRHFNNRIDIWSEYESLKHPAIKTGADTTLADLLLKNKVRTLDTKLPLQWRPESWWAAEIPGANASTPFDPNPFTWGIDRCLAKAYSETARDAYARKAIDLRMQFILDNPNPKLVFKSEPYRYYFDIWNVRTAGSRALGLGGVVYARLLNYSGWTEDERLVFLSSFDDSARWIFGMNPGVGWATQANHVAFEFGKRFPEWKLSGEYARWGGGKLSEIAVEGVQEDGSGFEASAKYYGLTSRKLFEMSESGLSDEQKARLSKPLSSAYDFLANMLQPNGYTVMFGDSEYTNGSEDVAQFAAKANRPDLAWIASRGTDGEPPAQSSRLYPEGGYFIMRSDFGGRGREYTDARQMVIHNGSSTGSHGHADLTSMNLYAFGRTLLVDPGQYEKADGTDACYSSRVHSMLVVGKQDVERKPGPSEWVSNNLIDWFDGRHYGYNNQGGVDYIRRKVAFVKPDYFIVEDSVKGKANTDWAQVWNLSDPDAKVDPRTKTIQTTFADGGNLMILNCDATKADVEQVQGITAARDAIAKTKIIRLHKQGVEPVFTSLLYPYKAGTKLSTKWLRVAPDGGKPSNRHYFLVIACSKEVTCAAFGEAGKPATYRKGSHRIDADFVSVRLHRSKAVKSFAWARGRELVFNRTQLAKSNLPVQGLSVEYAGQVLMVEATDSEPSLAIRMGRSAGVMLNGKSVAKPLIKRGMYYPFADRVGCTSADDFDGIDKLTRSDEWTRVPESSAVAGGYTRHETDPGRCEAADFSLTIPESGNYTLEVHIPSVLVKASDKVEYRISAQGKPAENSLAITESRKDGAAWVVTMNQQSARAWVPLGEFTLDKGRFRISARNVTSTDRVYFIADAVRAVKK